MVRRDKLGRRIGRNWWREWNVELLMDATLAWERQAEAEHLGYPTESKEYEAEHPRPNLKQFLESNKGANYDYG